MKRIVLFLITSLVYISFFAAPGDLDTSFGTSLGYTLTSIDAQAVTGRGLVRQSDGKIVAVGNYYDATSEKYSVIVARYNVSGSLDTSFGSAGVVKTTLANSTVAQSVVLQSNGKIIVAANYNTSNNVYGITVLCYTARGVLDKTFGSGKGYTNLFVSPMCGMNSLLITTDNKIIVGGWYAATDGSTDAGILMARLTAWGVVDTTFGTRGYVKRFLSGYSAVVQSMIHMCTNSDIVSTGSIKNASGNDDCMLMKTTKVGASISSFGGSSGYTRMAISSSEQDVGLCLALQSDCKIVVAGQYFDTTQKHFKLFLIRYYYNGTIDRTFGPLHNGIVKISLSSGDDSVAALLFNGTKMIIVGSCVVNWISTLTLACYQSTGTRDTSFGSGGLVSMPIAQSWSNGAYIQNNKLFVVGGSSYGTGTNQLLLACFKLS